MCFENVLLSCSLLFLFTISSQFWRTMVHLRLTILLKPAYSSYIQWCENWLISSNFIDVFALRLITICERNLFNFQYTQIFKTESLAVFYLTNSITFKTQYSPKSKTKTVYQVMPGKQQLHTLRENLSFSFRPNKSIPQKSCWFLKFIYFLFLPVQIFQVPFVRLTQLSAYK